MSQHAELLSTRPADAEPGDLQALADVGLSTSEIVTLSQVIAFVSFQVRVIAALGALGGTSRNGMGSSRLGPGEPPAASASSAPPAASSSGRKPARIVRPPSDLARPPAFTVEQLEWTPWLEPLDLAHANPKQAAALEGTRGNSPYFRLLALDIDVLVERTATDRGIFYTPGGAPRADRELSAAATSRLNGCIYCTSVHARLASQLSKKTDAIERILDRGVAPGTDLDLDPRWQAVVDLAVALAPTPPSLSTEHVQHLRGLGLEDLEILDVSQAGGFFAWANRLMLTLGEPYVPA
jgi:alkylhydroperoxidase domain protein